MRRRQQQQPPPPPLPELPRGEVLLRRDARKRTSFSHSIARREYEEYHYSETTRRRVSPACYAAASSFSTALLNDGLSIPLPLFCESRLASGFRTMYSLNGPV